MCPVTFPDTNGGSFRSHMWMDRMNGRERLFHRPDLAWTYNKVMVVTKCTLKNIVRGWKKIVGKKWTDQRYEQDRTLDASSLCYHGSQFIYCFSVCSIYYLWSGVPHWHVGSGRRVESKTKLTNDDSGVDTIVWTWVTSRQRYEGVSLDEPARLRTSTRFIFFRNTIRSPCDFRNTHVHCQSAFNPTLLACSSPIIRRRTPWSITLSFLNTLELKTHSYV